MIAVLVFFTKLSIYLQYIGIGIPLLWLIGFLFISIPVLITIPNRLKYIPISIVVWCAAYLAIPLISILIFPHITNLQFMEDRIRSIVVLLLMSVIFSQHLLVLRWTKLTILLVTLSNVCMFIYEFFNPLAFYREEDVIGRASGLYMDANEASCAIILGMIFTIDFIKPKYRLFYALFVVLGIAVAFSRSGMIGWLIVVLSFVATKVIPRYQLPIFVLSLLVSITILSSQLNNLIYMKNADGIDLFSPGTIARIEFLTNPLGQEDDSSGSRISHVDEAWQKFARKPFVGNGLGSGGSETKVANFNQDTGQRSHNIYLDLMVEFGFSGALIYPLLLIASVWKARGELTKYTFPFIMFLLMWGFFSHTTLNSPFLLISYAIMANFTHQSRLRNL
ncbi:O-antigen ligase [Pleurocapsa sp. PCC 7319]|uniref:O-antigen ligase family protein n=1 Tax=Pleurocapsa sp. PCC 7319 TaxID=118161 RepID=UPI00034C6CF0|nr:O-antigen ligase family protein [Pleurocapsa sp. PCC 7319]